MDTLVNTLYLGLKVTNSLAKHKLATKFSLSGISLLASGATSGIKSKLTHLTVPQKIQTFAQLPIPPLGEFRSSHEHG